MNIKKKKECTPYIFETGQSVTNIWKTKCNNDRNAKLSKSSLMRGTSDFPGQTSPLERGWPKNSGERLNTWMQPASPRLITRSPKLEHISHRYHRPSSNPQYCNLRIRCELRSIQPPSYANCRWTTRLIELAWRVDISYSRHR